tara:strand:+ start:937 stop:1668 length:732 start_codon:yes stop_codon:yes gene_type:complete
METNYKTPKNLLSKGNTNAKTSKNSLKTFILYLAPHKQNDKNINICPMASKGCISACLYTAGRGKFSNVQNARINKTNFYIYDKEMFVLKLASEIIKETNKAKKNKEKIAFRLNGTSDIDFIYLLQKYAQLDVESLKENAVFYDYTKILGKVKKYKNYTNYHLTFSRAEDNNSIAEAALNDGANVAIVFRDGLPKFWRGYKVIDGDTSDILMVYNKNVVLGLKAKGEAKKDKSGFVVDAVNPI